MPSPRKASAVPKDAQYERVGRELLNVLEEIAAACASQMELSRPHPLTPAPSAGERAGGRAALKSVRAIPNPRPEDRRPKETRRPRSELIATPAEQQPIESGHSRNSDFDLLSGFSLRSSDFRAAEHDLPSTGRTLEQPWAGGEVTWRQACTLQREAIPPLPEEEHGQIAVKVIDPRGNELLVVKKLEEAR